MFISYLLWLIAVYSYRAKAHLLLGGLPLRIKDHMEAFGIVAKAAEDSNVEFNGVLDKYTPNRAERRQAEKQQPGD